MNTMAEDVFPIFLQPLGIGRLVNAINRRVVQRHQTARDGFVGQKHEFLNELMREVVFYLFDPQNLTVVIQKDFRFGKVQVQGAGFEARPADALRERERLVKHSLGGIQRLALKKLEDLLIVVPALRTNDRGIKLRL